jgi:uncharacterized protein YjbI with pentapeptide repeats
MSWPTPKVMSSACSLPASTHSNAHRPRLPAVGPAYGQVMTKPHRQKDWNPVPPAPPDVLDDLAPLGEVPKELRDAQMQECDWRDLDLMGRDARGLELVESRVQGVDLAGAALRRATFRDVLIMGGDWANIDATEVVIRRAELSGLRLTGAILAGAGIRDARFSECRFDLCSMRFATLDQVRFEECRMEEVDFYEATLKSVAFIDCDLSRAMLAKATLERSEMRGCELRGINGADRLRGVSMPWLDILRSAAVLADGVGVRILDED